IPGASVSIQEALTDIATGALTRGRTPDSVDIGAIARSMSGMRAAAHDIADALASGTFSDAVDAATAVDHVLGGRLAQARDITTAITGTLVSGGPAYPSATHDRFGNAVEQLAVDVTRLVATRG